MTEITYHSREATEQELALTVARLREHSEACLGRKVTHEPFSVTAYRHVKLVGSIIGKIYSGWMHLDLVWVDDEFRKRGIGRELLKRSIEQARAKGLGGIEVWTQSWQAPEFYLRCGFTIFAELGDFLPGQKRYALRYYLTKGAA